MTEYDIGGAFKAIEDELIASMIRNMDRHRAEETKEGVEWSMWQAEQLKALLFNGVYPERHLLTCHLQQPLVLLLVHLVQAVHYLDLHLAFLPSCSVGSRRQTY